MASKKKKIETLSESITNWVGTPQSIVVHTIFFTCMFLLVIFGWSLNEMLLVLTTIVSIEAIYLALFIQMTVNKTTESLEDVEEDIEEIQEDDKEDDVKEKEFSNTLKTIEDRLNKIHGDIDDLRKKNTH